MVQEKKDAITGAVREAVLISPVDAVGLGLKDGDTVILKNEVGEFKGRVYTAPIKPGNLQVHWPEGNILLDRNKRSREVAIPDYNALVRLERYLS
ncbi:MAG: molybdopterin dinucleotide binding domain-containing protein [Coleofasciculus sp. G1-WW12-02]